MNRLRSQNNRDGNQTPIRFFACGEYGTLSGRFHFHALIYNSVHYTEERQLTRLWPHGFAYIGTVTKASIEYTADYSTKFEADPQKQPLTGRSAKPMLGERYMRMLGKRYREQGHQLPTAPTSLSWNNRNYPVDLSMRISFMEGYDPTKIVKTASGTRRLDRSLLHQTMTTEADTILGYDLELKLKKAISQEDRMYRRIREMEHNGHI